MQRIIPVRTLLYVNSRNRVSGTPYDFKVILNNELIKAPKGHYTQVTVEQVSMTRTWYSVQSGYNTFNIVDDNSTTTIIIPVGFYNVFDVRSELQQLLPSWTITYDRKMNRFTFTRPSNSMTSYTLIFPHYVVAELLGFDVSEQPTFTIGNPSITSSKSVKVNNDASVFIHSSLPRQKMSAIDNIEPIFRESDVLCAIPITSAPFDNITFAKNNDVEFRYNIFAPTIHEIRFYLTNEQGVPLQIQHDWDLVLSIDYIPYNDNDVMPVVEDIRDYMKLYLLHNKEIIDSADANNDTTDE